MIWHELYRQKTTTAETAVSLVLPGHTVYIHPGCATPTTLVKALLARSEHLRDVEIIQMLTLGSADYARPEYEGRFRAMHCLSALIFGRPWLPGAPTILPFS